MNSLKNSFWGGRIEAARKRGMFNGKDCDLAHDWTTCACGKQDAKIPRHSPGYPTDTRLFNLGVKFFSCIERNDFDLAESTLLKIEKRASEILAEQKGKK